MMKARLTENGIMSIYNFKPQAQPQVKVQVIYFAQWKDYGFLRVTDSKHLSPIMILLNVKEKFCVGDIILIKQVECHSPSSFFNDEEILLFIDAHLNHILVKDYHLVDKKNKVGPLYSASNTSSSDYSYWNDLSSIKNCSIILKGDSDNIFKLGNKRLEVVRNDCNSLRERGNDLFKQQKFDKAILHYDMAKQIDHYDARLWNNSSHAFFSNSEFVKATRDALVALKLEPFNKKCYFRACKAMEQTGNITGAIEVLEAGLFLCGKCEDLEKCLKDIKGKIEENQNLNVNNTKKKISNGESVDSASSGATTITTNGNIKKNIKPKESPHKKIKEVPDSKTENNIDTPAESSKQKDIPPLTLLEVARELFEKANFKTALELYESASVMWECGKPHELAVLHYLMDVCKIKLKKSDLLQEAKNSLLFILQENHFPFIPAIHFWLSNLYEVLEDHDKIVQYANSCFHLLQGSSSSYPLYWPGTVELIPGTSPEELKKWFHEGTWGLVPLARCRHSHCLSIQNSKLAKIDIYSSDIDFRGYVEVECEELCAISYHPCCWKSIKEQSDIGPLGKKTDKDFLGLACFTPDCSGKIISIRIYDENNELKNEISKDKKEKKSSTSSKLKKKKDKKKSSSQGGRSEDRKRLKGNDDDFNKSENDIEIIKEETAAIKPNSEEKKKCVQGGKSEERKKLKCNELEDFNKYEDEVNSIKQDKSKQNQDKTFEQLSFEGSNYKVLKPGNDLEEFNASQAPKKNKNKKKKKGTKPLAQISIEEEVEDRFAHNEYLTRLRALRSHGEAGDSPDAGHTWLIKPNIKQTPDCMLDPERPFYLPKHLQENPAQLENILRAKMSTATSSSSSTSSSSENISKETIATLLEFMYNWLKAENTPMLISDSRIKDYVAENFPKNALTYVNKCGGIGHFLLQSPRFALFDDILCVMENHSEAKQFAVQVVLDKFKSTKFLISDGYRAVKLSHLLEDSKSTCSSNSSMSATRATTNSLASSESLGYSKVNYAFSATPYKTAALAKITPKEPERESAENKFIPVGQSKSAKHKLARKPKLKTMDIDVFDDEIEPIDMEGLFNSSQGGTTSNDKSFKGNSSAASMTKPELFFQSDEELENEMASLQLSSKSKANNSNVEFRERISVLEFEISLKADLLTKLTKEKELLASQNQELTDRCAQIKVKSGVEISTWKKNVEEVQDQLKISERNFESFRNQKEGEVRKLLLEKSRLQEELKAYTLKTDSLQLTVDQLNSSKAQYEEDRKQTGLQFAEQQLLMMKYQNAAKDGNDRARDAEVKYLTMKRDLIKMNLEKTRKRLTAESNKMQECLMDAGDDTQPNLSMLQRSIKEWEETISKLTNTLVAVHDDGKKLIDCINRGQSLNALPPGDLQVPSVPDLTVAHLLFIGRGVLTIKASDKVTPSSSTMGFLGLSNSLSSGNSGGLHSQFGGLNSFSLGQLGVTPSSSTGHGVSVQSNDLQRAIMGTGPMGLSSSRLGSDLGLGISSHSVSRRMNDGTGVSTGFAMNGVSPLSSLIGEDMNKGGSSNSSPIPSSIHSLGSLSGGSDYNSSFSGDSKNLTSSDTSHLFRGGQNPWSFADDHMKPISFSNQTLNIDDKEIKRPSKTMSQNPSSDHTLIPSSSMSSLHHSRGQPTSINKMAGTLSSGGSAYGLQSLLEASNRAEPRTVATPTTPTATKPKFQNLRSSHNIGAIGALPPKVVRPIPRPGAAAAAIGTMPGLQSVTKEDLLSTSGPYKRLIEGCKQKFGNEYPAVYIQKAIREVREQNKNSLSGLALETILEQVEAQLRLHKRIPPAKPSIAPWAQLTQQQQAEGMESQWQGPVRGGGNLDNISEDHCAICLEMLNSSPTMPLPCLHEFHIKCIKNWLVRKSDCPICRKFALNSDEFPSLSGHGQ